MSTLRDEKRLLRREVWNDLRGLRHARFPGARGRIPNFVGAEAAARALALDPRFRRARALACNPDLAQRTVRLLALRAGKRVYLARPRLAGPRAFVLLDPERLDPDDLWRISGIGAALEVGRAVDVTDVEPLDLFIVGCVAVGADGARLGKGGAHAGPDHRPSRPGAAGGARSHGRPRSRGGRRGAGGRLRGAAAHVPAAAGAVRGPARREAALGEPDAAADQRSRVRPASSSRTASGESAALEPPALTTRKTSPRPP